MEITGNLRRSYNLNNIWNSTQFLIFTIEENYNSLGQLCKDKDTYYNIMNINP